MNLQIDQLISSARKKCHAYNLIYDPAQERRFAHNILKENFQSKIAEMGFENAEAFVETIIDMSMQPGNWWQHKIAGLRDIHRNYPKVYAGYMSAKKEKEFISSF